MSKLTNDLREKICKNAVNATYKPKADKLKEQEAKLAVEAYNHIFPKKIRDIIATVPENWIRSCDCLRFNAGGWQVQLCAGKKMPTPASNHCDLLGSLTGEIAEKIQAFSQEKKKLDEEWRSALSKMAGFLQQFTTFKKLEEAWPEGKKFYHEYNADRVSANVPAVITKEINDMLGLKTSVKKNTAKAV